MLLYATKRIFIFMVFMLTVTYMSNCFANNDVYVDRISMIGLKNINQDVVLRHVNLNVNQFINKKDISAAISSLYQTGLFSDVQIKIKGTIVEINLKEYSLISSVYFNGIKSLDSQFVKNSFDSLGVLEGSFFNPSLLKKAVSELKIQYINIGMFNTKIFVDIEQLSNDKLSIKINVEESALSKIRDIRFIGNKSISSNDLSKSLLLTSSNLLSWYTNNNIFYKNKLDDDIKKLHLFYLDRGYIDISIDSPQILISQNMENIYITYNIHEGNIYHINDIRFTYKKNCSYENIHLENFIKFKKSDLFSMSDINITIKNIKNYLGSLGYAFAEVDFEIEKKSDKEVDIIFNIDLKNLIYVNRIEIKGNCNTSDLVIRQELCQFESSLYDTNKLSISKNNLNKLGFFNNIDFNINSNNIISNYVDLIINVDEKKTGIVNFSLGYGSSDKIILSANIREDNFYGTGKSLLIELDTSQLNQCGIFSYKNPYFTKRGISQSLTCFYKSNDVWSNINNLYNKSSGLNINYSIPLSEYKKFIFGTSLEKNQIKLTDESSGYFHRFLNQYGDHLTSLILSTGLLEDTRDNTLLPNNGYLASLNLDFSTINMKYYKSSIKYQYFKTFYKNYIFSLSSLLDYGNNYDNLDYPIIKNFHAGGIGTVRCYSSGSLGPRDNVTGEYLGGTKRIIANTQIYLPIPISNKDQNFRWFLFADAGKISASENLKFNNGCSGKTVIKPCDWRTSCGVGFSWISPIGLIQLSYGYPINKKNGDSIQNMQFQIGTNF